MAGNRKRNWGQMALIGVLAVSLLGNALSLGALARLRALRADLLGPAAQSAVFPRDIRADLRTALAAHGATLRPALHDLVAARAAVVATGSAQPFDRSATEAAMAEFRTRLDRTLDQTQAVMLDALDQRAAK
ncbi:MAG: hypothetical protein PHX82_09660 [Paracoccaceae bacterium]|nr:hypothetical protein [Paracoccaceae bacterium]